MLTCFCPSFKLKYNSSHVLSCALIFPLSPIFHPFVSIATRAFCTPYNDITVCEIFSRGMEAFVLEKLLKLVFVKIRFRTKDREESEDGNLFVGGSSGVWIDFRDLLLDHPEAVNGVWGDNSYSVTTLLQRQVLPHARLGLFALR